MKKKDIVKFLTWLRNGTAFCASWFLFLVLIACRISRTEFISAHSLEKMMVLSFCVSSPVFNIFH